MRTLTAETIGHISRIFQPLNKAGAIGRISQFGQLSTTLKHLKAKHGVEKEGEFPLTLDSASLFASGAVEMWQRGVHSFLMSASLTNASPLWASVTGYYASHYTVRALAHALGSFQVHTDKWVAKLSMEGASPMCAASGGNKAKSREHKFYWDAVKQCIDFKDDPLFTFNNDINDDQEEVLTDSTHRNIANYVDHIANFPRFAALEKNALLDRIEKLSKVELTAMPELRRSGFPSAKDVQLVAYHRLVRFRRILDDVLGTKNSFWTYHRKPQWCSEYLDFQATEPLFLRQYLERA